MLIPAGGATEAVGADEDDRTAAGQKGHRRLEREPHAFQVGADHRVDPFLGDLRERRVSVDDGIGDADVEAPMKPIPCVPPVTTAHLSFE